MFCDKCGTPLRENAKFCGKCGAPVLGAAAAAPTVTPAPASKSSSGKTVGIVIAIVAVAIALIVLLVLLVSSWLTGFRSFLPSQEENYVYEIETDIPEYEAATEPPEYAPEISQDALPESNPYYECYNAETGYVLPESDRRYYSRSDISTMSVEQLEIAYHEIAARHGATFQDPDVQEYFNCMDWYTPGSSVQLSDIEISNQEMLRANKGFLDGSIYREGNPYIRLLDDSYTYIVNDSQNRYLDSMDLKDLSADELQLARSEIYARHGYICKSEDLRDYFYCKDWYIPSIPGDDFDTSVFSATESSNVELIRVYEKLAKGVEVSANNPYAAYYYGEIFPDSSNRKLTEADVSYMTKEQLILARNEIFCRNGYVCNDEHLFEYFAQCSWYAPATAPGDLDRVELNSTETANVNFLKKYQTLMSNIPDLWSLDTSLTRTVETPYFTVKVPKYFKDYCEISKGKDDGVYDVKFYETLSKGFDSDLGRVFTITVVPSSKDFTQYSNYSAVGSITNSDGKAWNILIRYPAGTEYTNITYDLYWKMRDEVWRIMDTLTPESGYYFSYSMVY